MLNTYQKKGDCNRSVIWYRWITSENYTWRFRTSRGDPRPAKDKLGRHVQEGSTKTGMDGWSTV